MMKRWLPAVMVGALALLLVDAGTSSARIFGGRGGYGMGYGGYGMGYGGYGMGWGNYYNPGMGYGYGSPGYLGSGYSYWPTASYWNYPASYSYGTGYGFGPYMTGNTFYGNAYAYSPTSNPSVVPYNVSAYALRPRNYVSFYPPVYMPTSPQVTGGAPTLDMSRVATIELKNLPANAKVWFDGEATREQGADRRFVSPPLERGQRYHYNVKVQWTDDNGKTQTRTRTIHVKAGEPTVIEDVTKGSDRDRDRDND